MDYARERASEHRSTYASDNNDCSRRSKPRFRCAWQSKVDCPMPGDHILRGSVLVTQAYAQCYNLYMPVSAKFNGAFGFRLDEPMHPQRMFIVKPRDIVETKRERKSAVKSEYKTQFKVIPHNNAPYTSPTPPAIATPCPGTRHDDVGLWLRRTDFTATSANFPVAYPKQPSYTINKLFLPHIFCSCIYFLPSRRLGLNSCSLRL